MWIESANISIILQEGLSKFAINVPCFFWKTLIFKEKMFSEKVGFMYTNFKLFMKML